jgi:hypothetical protein
MLIYQCPYGVELPGQGFAVDSIVPGSFDLPSPDSFDTGVSSAELQGLVFTQWSELGGQSLAQLEARPPDFLGHFNEQR